MVFGEVTPMYYYEKPTTKSFEETEAAVRHELKERGFGILTEIDAKKILKEKIDLDIEPYKILGACNPKFASHAIGLEENIGVLLPCNVLLREKKGQRFIVGILPTVQMGKIGNPALQNIAEQVELLLTAAIDRASE